jgi:hypothetical protein
MTGVWSYRRPWDELWSKLPKVDKDLAAYLEGQRRPPEHQEPSAEWLAAYDKKFGIRPKKEGQAEGPRPSRKPKKEAKAKKGSAAKDLPDTPKVRRQRRERPSGGGGSSQAVP